MVHDSTLGNGFSDMSLEAQATKAKDRGAEVQRSTKLLHGAGTVQRSEKATYKMGEVCKP